MKTKNIFTYAILAFCLGCLLWSCKKNQNHPDLALGNNLIKSAEKYASLLEKRGDGPGSFTIENIQRNGDMLTIRIKGGCKEEDFTMVWDGSIAFSDPGQVNLVLYNASGSNCGSNNQFDIQVNLRQVLDKHDPKDFMFNVANGSFKQDKSLNPNGSVTSKQIIKEFKTREMKEALILNKEKVIKAAPSEIWKIITSPEYFDDWMFVPGRSTDGEHFGLGSKIQWMNEKNIVYLEGEVIAFVPNTSLVIALQDISWDKTDQTDRVTYEFHLAETENGTKLRFRLGDLSIDPEGQAWYDSYHSSDEVGAIESLILASNTLRP